MLSGKIQVPYIFNKQTESTSINFGTNISCQTPAMFSILNRLTGTAANTSHAMRTMLFPHRLSVFKPNVFQRTNIAAFSAGNTGVSGIKFFCVNKRRIKNSIHNATVYLILKNHGSGRYFVIPHSSKCNI